MTDLHVWATTDSEQHAAAIAQRLINEGRNATTRDIADLEAEGHSLRSNFRYAVLLLPNEEHV